LVNCTATNRAEFIQKCRAGEFDGVVAAYRTLESVCITGLIDEELVQVLPKSLRFLANCGMLVFFFFSSFSFLFAASPVYDQSRPLCESCFYLVIRIPFRFLQILFPLVGHVLSITCSQRCSQGFSMSYPLDTLPFSPLPYDLYI
jgi:hypothetical protein